MERDTQYTTIPLSPFNGRGSGSAYVVPSSSSDIQEILVRRLLAPPVSFVSTLTVYLKLIGLFVGKSPVHTNPFPLFSGLPSPDAVSSVQPVGITAVPIKLSNVMSNG